jgi:hypothetical protein
MIKDPTDDASSKEPDPLPRPVPPSLSTEPFSIEIEPHVPFPPLPMPADNEPPLTKRWPADSPAIVRFEPEEQSRPARAAERDKIAFAPRPISVIELPEIVVAVVAFKMIFSRTRTALALPISTQFAVEFPLTKIGSESLYV